MRSRPSTAKPGPGLETWPTGEAAARPVFWQPSPPWFEGFAQFFERQVYTETFTQRYVPELPKEDRAALASWRARHLAEWITDALVRTEVERRLYEDPANLEAVARHGAQVRATLTGRPAAPSTEAGVPMSEDLLSPILWNYPAYSQNFLFAYLTEAALDEAMALGADLAPSLFLRGVPGGILRCFLRGVLR